MKMNEIYNCNLEALGVMLWIIQVDMEILAL